MRQIQYNDSKPTIIRLVAQAKRQFYLGSCIMVGLTWYAVAYLSLHFVFPPVFPCARTCSL